MFSQLNPGLGNLRVAGLSLVQSLAGGFLTTNNHANRELYDKSQAELVADRNVGRPRSNVSRLFS
jgi:hypothetical protein